MGTRRAYSVLRSGRSLGPDRINGIIADAIAALDEVAAANVRGDYVIRDLFATDLSDAADYTNELWNETTGTAIGWATITGADGVNAVADETFLAFWGVKMITPMASETTATTFQALHCPAEAFRITTGAALVAKWNLVPILHVIVNDLAESSVFYPEEGYTEEPLIVTQNTPLKIEEYGTTTAADPYNWVMLGAVAEKAGKQLAV